VVAPLSKYIILNTCRLSSTRRKHGKGYGCETIPFFLDYEAFIIPAVKRGGKSEDFFAARHDAGFAVDIISRNQWRGSHGLR
jgi:hypothetical protein